MLTNDALNNPQGRAVSQRWAWTGLTVAMLAACGGGTEVSQTAMEMQAQAAAALPAVTVRAKGYVAPGVAPVMAVRINGVHAARFTVSNTTVQDFVVAVPAAITSVQTVDVVFENDQWVAGVDVNLGVDSVSFNQRVYRPTDAGVVYDRGSGSAAWDGVDVITAPTSLMAWSGALRFLITQTGADPVAGSLEAKIPSVTAYAGLPQMGPVVVNRNFASDTRFKNNVIENVRISNPNGPCIEVTPGSPAVTIRNSEIGPCKGHGIFVNNVSGVTITHNYIHDTTQTGVAIDPKLTYADGSPVKYPTALVEGFAVKGYDARNLTMTYNRIHRVVSGLVAQGPQMTHIIFEKNYVVDVVSDRTKTVVQSIGGQMVQIAGEGQSIGASRVRCNVSNQTSPNSSTEDVINLNRVSGVSGASPVVVAYNKVVGGGPSSTSSTGINLGDDGGAYQKAYKNIVVNGGPVGITIASGIANVVDTNKVLHENYIQTHPGVWPSQLKIQNYSGKDCQDNRFVNNLLAGWKEGDGGGPIQYQDPNDPDQKFCTGSVFSGNVAGVAAGLPNAATLSRAEFSECQ